jgi:hypothetical protein
LRRCSTASGRSRPALSDAGARLLGSFAPAASSPLVSYAVARKRRRRLAIASTLCMTRSAATIFWRMPNLWGQSLSRSKIICGASPARPRSSSASTSAIAPTQTSPCREPGRPGCTYRAAFLSYVHRVRVGTRRTVTTVAVSFSLGHSAGTCHRDAGIAARLSFGAMRSLGFGGGPAEAGTHELFAGVAAHAARLRVAVFHSLLLRIDLGARIAGCSSAAFIYGRPCPSAERFRLKSF